MPHELYYENYSIAIPVVLKIVCLGPRLLILQVTDKVGKQSDAVMNS